MSKKCIQYLGGLWSSESVCSVCVMLCLGSVHELLKW